MAADYDRMVRVYLAMREKRSALKRQYEEHDGQIKAQMEQLEHAMLAHLNATGSQGVRTDHGTFFKQETIKPSVADWQAFYNWIRSENAFDALDKRVSRKFVTDYLEANNGSLPPGVNVFREYEVRIRRAD